jgi:FKBP-type peptidyl-prolyl cis-trans isomerase
MNQQNLTAKMQDPIYKKHVIGSVVYGLISLLVLVGGAVYVNGTTEPALAISQKEARSQEAKDKAAKAKADQAKQVEALITRVKPDLKITTIQEGTGDVVEVGNTVTINYTGKVEDGTVFDSSIGEGKTPFVVDNIGAASLIPGWNAGIPGMKKGGKYSLFIPAVHAYGDQQKSEVIKANSNLIFDLEILDVDKTPKVTQ